jgi:hypothetical protein
MRTIRALQVGALAVIANGMLALAVMAPNTALAASCSSNNYSPGCGCGLPCKTVSGCTVTASCPFACGIPATRPLTFCMYN